MFDGLSAYASTNSLNDAPYDFTKPTGITPPPAAIPSTRANIVTQRSYSRPLDDTETRFETWSGKDSIVTRCIGHQRWLWERAQGFPLTDEQEEELAELQLLLERREGMLSGRTLWLGGTETAKKREASQFNCSFSRLSTIHDVVDHHWLLLQGCGVGSMAMPGTLNGFAKQVEEIITIPSVRTKEDWEAGKRGNEKNKEWLSLDCGKRTWNLKIGDSAESWAKSLGKIMAMKDPVDRIVLDYSEIRAPGIRLKGYGWISSGYSALSEAFEAICWIMSKAHNRLLNRMEMLDIENWMGTTLSSRRSAESVLCAYGDEEWEQFALAKRNHWEGNKQRAQSNNSLTFEDRPSKAELYGLFYLMQLGGGSEPGFVNMREARRRAPWVSGLNPCFEVLLGNGGFCVSGQTKLITRDGIEVIGNAVGKEIEIWNGKRWATVTPFQTGTDNRLLRVQFGDGSFLDVTENHRFFVADRFETNYSEVLAKDLLSYSKYKIHTEPFTIDHDSGEYIKDAYTIGFYVGDGHGNTIDIYSEVKSELPLSGTLVRGGEQNGLPKWRLRSLSFDWQSATKLREDLTPAFSWDRNSIIEFISGLADADGSNTATGAIRIYQGSESFCRDLQLLLTKAGIRSSVNFMTDADSNFGKRHKPMWYVQITDTTQLRTHRLTHAYDGGRCCKGKWQMIVSVTPLEGRHNSFCFTEPETTKGVFGNTLTGQCNLSEVVLNKFNGRFQELLRAMYIIGRANYRQTCVDLRDGVLQDSWHELNQFLRLCGVGITGIVCWEYEQDEERIAQIRAAATAGAHSMADELLLPRPKAVTTCKPSGTLSKCTDSTEGCHKPLGKYIFNNINFGIHNPLLPKLKAANYRFMDHPSDPTAVIVTFPVVYNDVVFDEVTLENGRVVEVNRETAIEQLERYKRWMKHYVDYNCSITISYSPEEVPEIVDWIYANWDSYVGVSFLYRNDPTKTAADLGFQYLPQTVVSKEEYDEYIATILPVDLGDNGTMDDVVDEVCSTGACPIR